MVGEAVDVAIVGGGPAGLSTALFLNRFAPDLAERTVVLERAHYPREKICAGAVGGRGLDLLDSIDARPDVPHVELNGIAVTTKLGRLTTRKDRAVGWVVRRSEFDAGLAHIAMKRGVRIEQGCTVKAVRAVARSPMEIDLDGGRTLKAAVVVGADGVGSIVRKALGWSRGKILAQAVEIDTERLATDTAPDIIHFDLTEPELRGYAWDFPTPLGGQLRMSRGVYDLGPRPLDPGARLDARVSTAITVGKKRRFSERGISFGEPLSRPRAILVGEAAGIDPILGEGIAQAIFYGARAAQYLAEKLRSGKLDFEDYAPLSLSGRLGLDLWSRAHALPFFYGATRDVAERLVTRSGALARAGLDYFAGRRVSRLDLAGAGVDLARSFTAGLRS